MCDVCRVWLTVCRSRARTLYHSPKSIYTMYRIVPTNDRTDERLTHDSLYSLHSADSALSVIHDTRGLELEAWRLSLVSGVWTRLLYALTLVLLYSLYVYL